MTDGNNYELQAPKADKVLTSDGEVFDQTDRTTGAQKGISSDHSGIHSGAAYSVAHKFTLAAGATDYLVFITPSDLSIHQKPSAIQTDGPKVTVEWIEAPDTVTGGTAITPRNRNRGFPDASTVVVKYSPSGVTVGAGIVLPGDYLGGGSGQGVTVKTGTSSQPENEWVFAKSKTYVLRIVNGGTASVDVNVNLFWYGH